MGEGCSDCGKPSIGRFDLWSRPPGADFSRMSSSDRSNYDRPLCADCITRRGPTAPPQAAGPLPAPVPSPKVDASTGLPAGSPNASSGPA